MKVLILNSPWINTAKEYGIKSGTRWAAVRKRDSSMPYFPFPYFMASAAAVLKENGIAAQVKDAVAEEISREDCLKYVADLKPGLLVVEAYTPSVQTDLSFLREARESTGCRTALCGAHATALPEKMLENNFIDFVLAGEYDYTLRDLALLLKAQRKDFREVEGLAFREKGKAVVNPRRAVIQDLNRLPFPDRDNLPMTKYNEPLSLYFPNARMVTSRGCLYSCIYCVEPLMYTAPGYRKRSVNLAIDEAQMLIDRYRVKEIFFDDTIFPVPRAREIAQGFLDRKITVAWSCWIDWNISFDDLKLLKKSGCAAVKIGVETVNREMLKKTGRPDYREKLKVLIRNSRRAGLVNHGAFMIGLPGESRQSLKENIDFAFSSGLDSCQFSVATPLPGTPFYKMAKENGWLVTEDWTKYEGVSTPVIEYPDCTAQDIRKAVEVIRKKKVRLFLRKPLSALQYVRKIYRMKGAKGLFREIRTKSRFVLKSVFRR